MLRIVLLLSAFSVFAEDLSRFNGQANVAFEAELNRYALANIIHYFDLSILEKQNPGHGYDLSSPLNKADFAISMLPVSRRMGNEHDAPNWQLMPLKKDAPEYIKKLMSKLVFHSEAGRIEFKTDGTLQNVEELFLDLELLAKETKVRQDYYDSFKYDSMRAEPTLGYHFNVSLPDRNLEKFVRHYRNLHFLRMIDRGFEPESVPLTYDLKVKNMVQLRDSRWFQVRAHVFNPRKEAEELLELLSKPNGIQKMEGIREQILTPQLIRKVHRSPFWLSALSGFDLNQDQDKLASLLKKQEIQKQILESPNFSNEEMMPVIRCLVHNSDPKNPPEFLKAIFNLKNRSEGLKSAWYTELMRNEQWHDFGINLLRGETPDVIKYVSITSKIHDGGPEFIKKFFQICLEFAKDFVKN